MLWIILFVFGVAIGSFLNVVALRYGGENFLFDPKVIGGRSRCPACKTTLRWFELIPLVSFVIQRGRCRHCRAKISVRYPIAELLSGIIFVAVPWRFSYALTIAGAGGSLAWLSAIWIAALEILLLIAYIDILLGIIPDELNIALLIVALIEIFSLAKFFGIGNPSFFGDYAAIFGGQANVWINHIAAGVAAAAFFGALVAVTRGRGMGMGDVKLVLPLGLLFGWPDILVITMFSFIVGGLFGIILVARGRKTMKSPVPFAPFLVAGAAVAFFWGSAIFGWYFHLIGV